MCANCSLRQLEGVLLGGGIFLRLIGQAALTLWRAPVSLGMLGRQGSWLLGAQQVGKRGVSRRGSPGAELCECTREEARAQRIGPPKWEDSKDRSHPGTTVMVSLGPHLPTLLHCFLKPSCPPKPTPGRAWSHEDSAVAVGPCGLRGLVQLPGDCD